MDSIIYRIVEGVTIGLTGSILLVIASYVWRSFAECRDVKYVQELLSRGMKNVMNAEDTYHSGMQSIIEADHLRAAQYNLMIKHLEVAIENWLKYLSHTKRKDLQVALDFYSIDSLHAVSENGKVKFVDLSSGRWPTEDMSKIWAEKKTEKLRAIKWLKLDL